MEPKRHSDVVSVEPIGIDISGYSEKKTDTQIDTVVIGSSVKQQNSIFTNPIRGTKSKKSGVLFEKK